nr:uncharacterized protein [uncultured bacterium]
MINRVMLRHFFGSYKKFLKINPTGFSFLLRFAEKYGSGPKIKFNKFIILRKISEKFQDRFDEIVVSNRIF